MPRRSPLALLRRALLGALLGSAALAAPAAAQTTLASAPRAIAACYVPTRAAVYRIDTPASPAPGAPKGCVHAAHVRFTWAQFGDSTSDSTGGARRAATPAASTPAALTPAAPTSAPAGVRVLTFDGSQWMPGVALAPAFTVQAGGQTILNLDTDGGLYSRGTVGAGTTPVSGAGTRMLWVPARAAFRAGRVESFGATYWDEAQLGIGSAAFGENTRASGANSFAANLTTTASGAESVALGNNGTASGERAFAFNGTATAVGAVAIGSGAQATSDDALAMGPSSIAGGLAAIVLGPSIANGNFGVAIGLQNSASGQFSVAIGKNARTANRQGSVVIGDGCAGFSSDSVYASANNQFVVRGCGGIRMFTSQNLSSGVEVAAGGGSWSSVSDRNRKAHFEAIDGEDVLRRLRAVPVSRWNYVTQDSAIRHLGPTAQDFHAAFGLGESDLLINTVDIDGVNMAAIQALEARTAAQQARADSLAGDNATLRAELTDLRARVARLEALLAPRATATPAPAPAPARP